MKPTEVPSPPTSTREVHDIGAAAFLVLRRKRLLRIKPGPRGYAVFIFETDEDTILAYLRDDDLVPPRQFLDTLKSLKALAGGGRHA